MSRMMEMTAVTVRRAESADVRELADLCAMLWPDGSVEEHWREIDRKIASGCSGTLPVAIFVAKDESKGLTGFIEIGLRSHADGCDAAHPVGFVEGWFVRESARGHGTGRQLLHAAERWARENGCIEMASDVLLENELSQHAHRALGFELVDRCVHFKRNLERDRGEQRE